MARRSTQPRELVRLTPLQFSLSVSIVVLLAAGAGFAGYIYGQRSAMKSLQTARSSSSLDQGAVAPSSSPVGDSQTPVTFYTTLTEPREKPPAKEDPVPTPAPTTTTASSQPRPAATATTRTPIMLQVASYAKEGPALELLAALSSEGYTGSVVRADLGERGTWYRVRVGPYLQERDARRALEKLREERSLKGFVVK